MERVVILSLGSTILSLVVNILSLLTIKGSILTQIDFDELAIQKQIDLQTEWHKKKIRSEIEFITSALE